MPPKMLHAHIDFTLQLDLSNIVSPTNLNIYNITYPSLTKLV